VVSIVLRLRESRLHGNIWLGFIQGLGRGTRRVVGVLGCVVAIFGCIVMRCDSGRTYAART
jgi:hypothetical protein